MTAHPHDVHDRRRRVSEFLNRGNQFRVRAGMRVVALLFLGLVIANGLLRGGYLDYEGSKWLRLPGKAAGLVGMAAEDISITGLTYHDPETLLSAVGVTPGGSLIGFDAVMAKRILENLDWIESAQVQRLFPNQLDITVAERQPFAIWQRGDAYYVIDRTGIAMSGLPVAGMVRLPLVTGEGANVAAADLFNHLEATPGLLLQVKAAARVGDRRWTLYLDSGVTVMLPETGWEQAIALVDEIDRKQRLLSKGIRSVDLRVPGRVVASVAVEDENAKKAATKRN
jgi:cell division protein FtsQ